MQRLHLGSANYALNYYGKRGTVPWAPSAINGEIEHMRLMLIRERKDSFRRSVAEHTCGQADRR